MIVETQVAELVAVGPEPLDRWRRLLPENVIIRLGRAPRHGWRVAWDQSISREHANLRLENGQLFVEQLETARNPIVVEGEPQTSFSIAAGGEFHIGSTRFHLLDAVIEETAPVAQALEFPREDVRKFRFDHAELRLEILSRLPDCISAAKSDEEFATRIAELLIEGIPRALAVAVVHYPPGKSSADAVPAIMRWEGRNDEIRRFRPSRRLILETLARSESLLHFWSDEEELKYTGTVSLDWAFCTPVKSDVCSGWFLYISGKFAGVGSLAVSSEEDLKGDMRFAEVLAQFVCVLRQVGSLERRQERLSQFFSPTVLETVSDSQAAPVLTPRECDISVLFCDVRGFSRKAELAQHDLHTLLKRVSNALGVMTRAIVRHDGVIADFQGDAALGFWGWPIGTADGPLPACLSALEIQAAFAEMPIPEDNPHERFYVGIGIAHGRAIAGKIGTNEQMKVGVFGPVVNLGARLEGLTKHLSAPILLDEATAEIVRETLSPTQGRIRRVARIRPQGLEQPVTVSQLLPPAKPGTGLQDEDIINYEKALEMFCKGRWALAMELLDRLPIGDRVKNFLLIFMAQQNYDPPPDWDGVVSMSAK